MTSYDTDDVFTQICELHISTRSGCCLIVLQTTTEARHGNTSLTLDDIFTECRDKLVYREVYETKRQT